MIIKFTTICWIVEEKIYLAMLSCVELLVYNFNLIFKLYLMFYVIWTYAEACIFHLATMLRYMK